MKIRSSLKLLFPAIFMILGISFNAFGASEYCNYLVGTTEVQKAYITIETDSEGKIIMSIAPYNGDTNTAFRNSGYQDGRVQTMKVNNDPNTGYKYFTRSISSDKLQITFTPVPGMMEPGDIVYIKDVLEYRTSGNGDLWPTYEFTYTYGSSCEGVAKVNTSTEVITFTPLQGVQTFTVSGENISGDLILKAPKGLSISPESITPDGEGKVTNETVTVTWEEGASEGAVVISGGGLPGDKKITVLSNNFSEYCNRVITQSNNGKEYPVYLNTTLSEDKTVLSFIIAPYFGTEAFWNGGSFPVNKILVNGSAPATAPIRAMEDENTKVTMTFAEPLSDGDVVTFGGAIIWTTVDEIKGRNTNCYIDPVKTYTVGFGCDLEEVDLGLNRVSISPANPVGYVGEGILFIATPYDGNNNVLEGVSISWTCAPDTSATINPTTGVFNATVSGTYVITCSAEKDGVTKLGNASVTVNEQKRLDKIVLSLTGGKSVYGVGSTFNGYSIATKDQYGQDFPSTVTVRVNGVENATVNMSEIGTYSIVGYSDSIASEPVTVKVVSKLINNPAIEVTAIGDGATGNLNVLMAGQGWRTSEPYPDAGADYPVDINFDLKEEYMLDGIQIYWENACARTYEVYVDGEKVGEETARSGGGYYDLSMNALKGSFITFKLKVPNMGYGYNLLAVNFYGGKEPQTAPQAAGNNESNTLCWTVEPGAAITEFEIHKDGTFARDEEPMIIVPHRGEAEYCYDLNAEELRATTAVSNTYQVVSVDLAGNKLASDEVTIVSMPTGISDAQAQTIDVVQKNNIITVIAPIAIESVQLYAVNGQTVASAVKTNSIDVSGLANGIYVLKVKDVDNNTYTFKVAVK